MPCNITVLNEEDYITSEWSGGITTQMYIYPENSIYKNLDFKWRISSATVELNESDFTELENVHRFITTLDNELKLTHDYENFIILKPFEIYEFDGAIKTHSYGKVKDLNLMLANKAKGRLENLLVDKEFVLNLSKGDCSEKFEIFYSYDKSFIFNIDGEEIELNKNEILLLQLESTIALNIKEKNNISSFLLHSSINI